MALPLTSTPILNEEDAINFVETIEKEENERISKPEREEMERLVRTVELDVKNNVGYLRLSESKSGKIFDTVVLPSLNIDVDKDGYVVGIEFLNVDEQFATDKAAQIREMQHNLNKILSKSKSLFET